MSPAFLGCQNALYSVPRLAKEGENFLLNLHPQALEQIILDFLLSFICTKLLASLENWIAFWWKVWLESVKHLNMKKCPIVQNCKYNNCKYDV